MAVSCTHEQLLCHRRQLADPSSHHRALPCAKMCNRQGKGRGEIEKDLTKRWERERRPLPGDRPARCAAGARLLPPSITAASSDELAACPCRAGAGTVGVRPACPPDTRLPCRPASTAARPKSREAGRAQHAQQSIGGWARRIVGRVRRSDPRLCRTFNGGYYRHPQVQCVPGDNGRLACVTSIICPGIRYHSEKSAMYIFFAKRRDQRFHRRRRKPARCVSSATDPGT